MPIVSVTTAVADVYFGAENLDSLSFKNGSTAGTIFLRNKQQTQAAVSSTDFEWSLTAGAAIGVSRFVDGSGIIGPWSAVSDTGGGVTLEILPIFRSGSRDR